MGGVGLTDLSLHRGVWLAGRVGVGDGPCELALGDPEPQRRQSGARTKRG